MTAEHKAISPVVTAVFRAWRQAGIDFLVLRNYDQLPHFTTNDVDVLVAPAQLRAAEAAVVAAARSTGFRLLIRAEFATLGLYLAHPDSLAQIHFDLFTELKWRGFDFVACDGVLARKTDRELFAIPHPVDEAATNLLAFLIYTGSVKEKYRAGIAATFRAHSKAATELLALTYGRENARFLVEAAAQERWGEIEARAGALRRALVVRQLTRRPWATLKSLAATGIRLARRFARPPGLTVALCGADGCGKSTAGRAVAEGLSSTFSPQKSRYWHWKPPLFSARRRAARKPVSNPHAHPPRPWALSLVFFAFHWLEFFLGAPLRIRPIAFKGGLVLIDRFYYDFFVDQRRYRLDVPLGLVRLGYRLLSKPDLVMLLDAPPEVLRRRKQEVAPEETARQREAYRELVSKLPNGRIIDASQPPEKVAADIERAVFDFLASRTRA